MKNYSPKWGWIVWVIYRAKETWKNIIVRISKNFTVLCSDAYARKWILKPKKKKRKQQLVGF